MKKKILIPLIAGLLVVIGVILFLVLKSKDDSYFNIKILDTLGTVNVDRDGSSLKAQEGLKMRDKDYLKVGNDGFTRIDCDRETYSHFEHDSEATFIANSDKKLTIKLIKGEMVVELQKKLSDSEALSVSTPNTTMAIRGTVVAIKVTPTSDGSTRTVNYCLEGKAEVLSDDGTTKSIEAGEGWLTVSDESGNVIVSKEAGAEEFDFAGINIDTLKGADDNPMVVNRSVAAAVSEGDVVIDGTNFPDMIFRLYVMDQIDKDKNGVLNSEELDVWKIEVASSGIKDLKGIEFFKNIELLDCALNELTTLDLSQNTKLKSIYCRRNQLQSINVSNCKDLGYFTCEENELKTLDVSNCTKLQHLECEKNDLEELDLSNLSELTSLDCSYNSIVNLDVTNNTLLTHLTCRYNPLTQLDVSKNVSLYALYCDSDQLKKLDISNNSQMQYLYAGDNQIYSFDLSNNPILEEFSCYNCFLSEIDVSNNTKLQKLMCGSNHNLSSLDLSHNPELTTLEIPFTDISDIDLSNNPKLKYFNCLYCEKLTRLDISHNPNLKPENIDHSGIIINQ